MPNKILVESFYDRLIQSSMSTTDTQVVVDVAPVNDVGYEVINRGQSNQEVIKHRAIAGLILQQLLRGLSLTAITDTEVAGNKKSHLVGERIEQTNVHYFENDKVSNQADETIVGPKRFSVSPKSDVAAGSTLPAALVAGAPTAGGSVTDGLHSYKVSFVSTLGEETLAGTASNQITTGGGNNTVPLSSIPLGPFDTASRKIYRTVAGDTGAYKLVTTILDNTTTTYNDTTDDASLGADAPSEAVSYELMRYSETVRNSGDQTIDGIKTFTSIPVGPGVDPTQPNQLARKEYVDNRAGSSLQYMEYFAGESLANRDAVSRESLNNTAGGSDANFGRAVVVNGVRQAQSFIAGSVPSSFSMTASLRKVGAPIDNVVIEIQTDTAGSPSGTVVTNGTSNAVSAVGIGASYSDIAFTWASVPVLTAGNKYWFVLRRDGALSETDYYQVQYSTSNPFRAGEAKKFDVTWVFNTGASDDLTFSISGISATVVKSLDTTLNNSRGRRQCLGFVRGVYAQGTLATIQNKGRMDGFTGLTPFLDYYVSTVTPGAVVSSPVTRPNLGTAIETTVMMVEVDELPLVDRTNGYIGKNFLPPDVSYNNLLDFGGRGIDGILNITSGTTNLNANKYEFESITIAGGAVLSTTSTSGVMRLLARQNFILAGSINLADKITSYTAAAPIPLFNGLTFVPTGRRGGHGAGGGGGRPNAAAGGAGSGGGAGGTGGNGGAAGGAGTGGSTSQGAGGVGGANNAGATAGGASAGGGGNTNSASYGGGGGAGNPGGAGGGFGATAGGTGFGAVGGNGSAGGAGSQASGGGGGAGGQGAATGGMGLIINVFGNFDGTGGTIDTRSTAVAQAGGAGGQGNAASGAGAGGGGGGGGGEGGSAGSIRLLRAGSYIAPASILSTGTAGGAGGAGGAAPGGSPGGAGVAGPAGANGVQTISDIFSVYTNVY